MAADLFDIASERLEENTDMDRLAARGTLRLALKEAGLDARGVTVAQLRAVFEKLMPRELEARGVSDAAATCTRVINEIAATARAVAVETTDSPDDVFKRLGGR